MRVHISLPVTSLESSISFYSALFGEPATKRRPDYANFRLDEPAIHLALNERPAAAGHGDEVNHFGIEVANEVELIGVRTRLLDAGLAHRDEPNATCCYATGNKVWTKDPDGHTWEIWVRTGEAATMSAPDSTCCDKPAAAADAPTEARAPTSCC
ncbi:MAG TPA: ArsI/CadI family heavy metal resistance metalloenzyme [Kofleriaceae bacterium]|nr:ArsI/CadI family heavy metal resistance metalloenzyme [Kofleriaceae bacterium]